MIQKITREKVHFYSLFFRIGVQIGHSSLSESVSYVWNVEIRGRGAQGLLWRTEVVVIDLEP